MGMFIRFGSLLASFVLAMVVSSFIEAAAAPATCANVRCKSGTHCIETPAPKCVTDLTCANVRCRKGTHCVDKPTGPRCVRGPATQPKY
jgi:hypothetical protein